MDGSSLLLLDCSQNPNFVILKGFKSPMDKLTDEQWGISADPIANLAYFKLHAEKTILQLGEVVTSWTIAKNVNLVMSSFQELVVIYAQRFYTNCGLFGK